MQLFNSNDIVVSHGLGGTGAPVSHYAPHCFLRGFRACEPHFLAGVKSSLLQTDVDQRQNLVLNVTREIRPRLGDPDHLL